MDKLEIALEKGYYVDEDGNVFSRFRQLIPIISTTGYLIISVRVNGKIKSVNVHRLQAFQKFGKRLFKEGIEVRHLDDDKMNNSWDNIAIGTRSDNINDRPEELRKEISRKAVSSPNVGCNRKYDYPAIKADHQKGLGYKALKEKYDISNSSTLHHIIHS